MSENTWMSEVQRRYAKSYRKMVERLLDIEQPPKKEDTMQVSYNGFTGELVKLERKPDMKMCHGYIYDISIYDSEKQVTHSFTGVKLEDVKLIGGAVSFGG